MNSDSVRKVTIHHYDDEPERVEALRDNFIGVILRHNPDWLDLNQLPTSTGDPERYWSLRILRGPRQITELVYCMYRSSKKFMESATFEGDDVVILDAYEGNPNTGSPELVANKCIQKVPTELVRAGRVYISSAYLPRTHEICQLVPPENVISKPFALNVVAERLLQAAGLPELNRGDDTL